MKVTDIIKAQELCFIKQSNDECTYCKECPLVDCEAQNCQVKLAELTVDKLKELVELLDDKVNHHYYETLETLQEDNTRLRELLSSINDIASKGINE